MNKKNFSKKRAIWQQDPAIGGFTCGHCGKEVRFGRQIGTVNRNHCNYCLWSKHVDNKKGDRGATCRGNMQPIGLTFKHEGAGKQGELMLIHQCGTCGKLSINRIARDDDEQAILAVFEASLQSQLADLMAKNEITILSATDRPEVYRQLFGDSVLPPL